MADKWELAGNSKVLAVHAALLPNGKVLYFGGSEHDESATSVDATRLWNPTTNAVEQMPSPVNLINEPEDLFCCGHCLLPTGELLVAGGTEHYEKDAPDLHFELHHYTGIRSVNVFDWRDENWHYATDMKEGRWYPTLIVLHDGKVLAMSGHANGDSVQHENTKLEIFDPMTGKWSAPFDTTPHPLEDTGGDYWIVYHIVPEFYYPRLHLLPNRQIFSSTALRVDNKRTTSIIDLPTKTIRTIADPPYVITGLIPQEGIMENVYSRSAFASVMLPLRPPNYGVRILICGEKQAKLFEPNNEHLGWQNAGSERPYPMRAYLNAVTLPDATVVVIGGAMSERIPAPDGEDIGGEDKDRIPAAERYHPDTNTWEVLSFPSYEPIARVYHSVALLLPDGRVWIAGSNHDGARNVHGTRADGRGDARELRMEIYSPPYLFAKDGAGNDILDAGGKPVPAIRPVIEWVRAGCAYGQKFEIQTATLLREGDDGFDATRAKIKTGIAANQIKTVALIRCSSVTHAFNPDQRYVELVIDNANTRLTTLTVSGPPAAEIAPPGYYLLFILNNAGTPCVARFLRVSASYPIVQGVETSEDKPISTYDFGSVELGKTKEATFTLKNVGVGTLKLSNPSIEGDFRDKTIPAGELFGEPAKLKNTEINISLATANPGYSTVLKVRFTPTAYGTYAGTLNVETTALEARGYTIHLSARVVGLNLELTPAPIRDIALDFGDVPVGDSKILTITVRNIGTIDAVISDMVFDRAEVPPSQFHWPFVIPDRVVPVGHVRTFNVTYSPTIVGEAYAEATLLAESTPAPPSYQLSRYAVMGGTGTGPVVELTPQGLAFPDQLVRTTSIPQTVTLRNTGTGTLEISRISADRDFVQTSSCPASLAAGQSCDIAVSFHPSGGGTRTGILTIESNAVGSPHTIALNGIGLAEPIVTLSSASLDFGNQPVGTSGVDQTVTLTNDGAANLRVNGVALVGRDAGDFVGTADNCSGAIVPPERTCAVSVRFNANATGARNAVLEFSTNAGSSPHQVPLSGTGVPPPAMTINPTSLSFGNQQVGTRGAVKRVVLTNNGTGSLVITSISFSGAHPDDFKIGTESCAGTTLVPGGSCTVDLSFSPRAVGSRSAALTFAINAPGSPHTIPLSGTGLGSAVSFDPPNLLFPPQPVGSFSQRQEVTLTNKGNTILNISSITVSGDFRHDSFCGGNLAPGAFCIIRVICVPSAAGTRLGEITVVDDAAGSPHAVPLSGTGAAPVVTLSPAVLDFGNQQVGTRSATQMVALTNTGSAPLTISNLSLNGANPSDFFIAANTCAGSALQPGLSCSVSVHFVPSATGSRSASLVFIDNASDSPQSILLAGSGS